MPQPLVSIAVITYNHAAYVAQSLESMLSQKTEFPFLIVVGDDCSSDGTREIVIQYAQKYPEKILLKNPERNLGVGKNFVQVLQACADSGAKYIAYLEGDDYWTDPYKLQKQVDFMEHNADYSMCFSKVEILKERETNITYYLEPKSDTLYFKDIVLAHYIPTLTILFRNTNKIAKWITNTRSCDRALAMSITSKGPAKFMDEYMGVYRVHAGGITNTKKQNTATSDDAYYMFKKMLGQTNVFQKLILLYVIARNRAAYYLRRAGLMR